MSVTQIGCQLRKGKLSVLDLYARCHKRAEKAQELNVFITRTSDIARQQAGAAAARLESGRHLGPLDGIPVAFKDNFSTKGIQTSCASYMLKGYRPPYNATVVQKLLDQGAVMMGKTNLDEFAMGCGSVDSVYGPVRNPWGYQFRSTDSSCHDADSANAGSEQDCDWHIAGGSSGGSAVAVAAGFAFAALGSDTGGSVRNPASFCGVVGLKPTYGLLSRHGLIPLVNSLDVPGILTTTVDDASTVLNILAGHDPFDSTTVPDNFVPFDLTDDVSVDSICVGIPKEYHAPGVSPETLQAWRRVADMLEDGGAAVKQVSLPHTQHSIACYSVICVCEVSSNMARYDGIEFGHRADDDRSTESLYAGSRHKGFNDVVRGRILAGNFFNLRSNYPKYLQQALKIRRLITEDFAHVYRSGVDVLLTPTVLGDAPKYSSFSRADNRTRTMEQDLLTQPVNMAGLPAVTVPVTLSRAGLPIGLQIIGKPFQEKQMLTVAKWIEQRVNFARLDLDFLD